MGTAERNCKGNVRNNFAPNASVTREQIAAIMYRYSKFKGIDVFFEESKNIQSYKAASTISDFAAAPMHRAEIAAILHRFLTGNK